MQSFLQIFPSSLEIVRFLQPIVAHDVANKTSSHTQVYPLNLLSSESENMPELDVFYGRLFGDENDGNGDWRVVANTNNLDRPGWCIYNRRLVCFFFEPFLIIKLVGCLSTVSVYAV
jgi:hypothetical protein